MNLKVVFKLVSPVVMVVGFAMWFSAIVSIIYGESPIPLIIGGSMAILFSAITWFISYRTPLVNVSIQEGCAIATFSWIFACLFGALPFYTLRLVEPELVINFAKSFYESVSGFTTTGSSILTDVEIIPKGIMFWRSFTHWFGGMGIVVLAIAILPKLGIGGMQAFRMESAGPLKTDKLVPRISETGKILYKVYFAVTVVQILALLFVGVNLYDALIHTFGTVGTGGFSNYNASVAGLHNHAAEYIITFFLWISAANFGLTYLVIWKRDFKALWNDSEFKVYTSIVMITILLITLSLHWYKAQDFINYSWADSFRLASFQVLTIISTAGFATTDFNLWPVFPVAVLVFLMFVGGSTGSTGGGLKVMRHIINFKLTKQELLKIVSPNLITTVKLGGRAIDYKIAQSVMALTILYLSTFFAVGFFLTLYGYDLVTAFTASIANLGNIGPGLNRVGPAANYAFMPNLPLWVLSFAMLLGRLEIYTILALFIPSVWKKRDVHVTPNII